MQYLAHTKVSVNVILKNGLNGGYQVLEGRGKIWHYCLRETEFQCCKMEKDLQICCTE